MRYFLFVFSISILWSCGGEGEPPTDLREDYFPLRIGAEYIYQMDSTVYNFEGSTTTTSYRRETVLDTFLRGNVTVYRIEIARKESLDDSDWTVTGFDEMLRDQLEVQRTIENQRYLALQLPIAQGAVWDGLAFIDENREVMLAGERFNMWQDWGEFELRDPAMSVTIQSENYDDVIRVTEADFSDEVLVLRQSFSDYAANVGLVRKQQRIFDLSCTGVAPDLCYQSDMPWEDQAEMGFSLLQELISYK